MPAHHQGAHHTALWPHSCGLPVLAVGVVTRAWTIGEALLGKGYFWWPLSHHILPLLKGGLHQVQATNDEDQDEVKRPQGPSSPIVSAGSCTPHALSLRIMSCTTMQNSYVWTASLVCGPFFVLCI